MTYRLRTLKKKKLTIFFYNLQKYPRNLGSGEQKTQTTDLLY